MMMTNGAPKRGRKKGRGVVKLDSLQVTSCIIRTKKERERKRNGTGSNNNNHNIRRSENLRVEGQITKVDGRKGRKSCTCVVCTFEGGEKPMCVSSSSMIHKEGFKNGFGNLLLLLRSHFPGEKCGIKDRE